MSAGEQSEKIREGWPSFFKPVEVWQNMYGGFFEACKGAALSSPPPFFFLLLISIFQTFQIGLGSFEENHRDVDGRSLSEKKETSIFYETHEHQWK